MRKLTMTILALLLSVTLQAIETYHVVPQPQDVQLQTTVQYRFLLLRICSVRPYSYVIISRNRQDWNLPLPVCIIVRYVL